MEQKLTIVLPEIIGRIAPELYGHFTEHIGGEMYGGLWVGKDSPIPHIHGFRKAVVDGLRQIKAPVIRWPGGCFAEVYNWRDGIGEDRPIRPNWWTCSDNKYETNEVGTHEFLDLCELVGAKAYLAVNVTGLTPQSARDWMDYCLSPRGATTLALEREKNGHPEPFDVPYWGVGNENWGGGGNMTPDFYALEYRRYAMLMDNAACGRAKLIVGGADGPTYGWTQGLCANLSTAFAPAHGMSFHYYCGASGGAVDFNEEDWYNLVGRAGQMNELITRHWAVTRGYGLQDRFKLVIDEWGCWHPGGSGPSRGANLFEQQSTMRDAVISALTLNIFNNQCDKVQMANVAQCVNNLHCLFLADNRSDACVRTPTFHVFDMFKGHQNGQAVRTLIAGNDGRRAISASASVKDDHVTLTLANLSCTESASVALEQFGAALPARADMTLLTAPDMHAHNTFEAPDAVTPVTDTVSLAAPLTLPAASCALVEWDL